MMLLVCHRISRDDKNANMAATAKESPDKPNTIAAIPATKATKIPTMRNLPKKLKSLRVTKAMPDITRKVTPVPLMAVITSAGPFGNAK